MIGLLCPGTLNVLSLSAITSITRGCVESDSATIVAVGNGIASMNAAARAPMIFFFTCDLLKFIFHPGGLDCRPIWEALPRDEQLPIFRSSTREWPALRLRADWRALAC